MIIQSDTFDEMKVSLEDMINRNSAGLDDVMLKKMLLTYYRGRYLDDTAVLIELTKEDLEISEEKWAKLFDYKATKDGKDLLVNMGANAAAGAAAGAMLGNGPGAIIGAVAGLFIGAAETPDTIRVLLSNSGANWLKTNRGEGFYPYEVIGGDTEKGIGEDGHLYIKTTGMVKIYAACDRCNGIESGGTTVDSVDCTSCKKIIYYKSEVLKELYEKEYIAMLDEGDKCADENEKEKYHKYAYDVLEYLKKCYTYGAEMSATDGQQDCISMYSERKENDEGSSIEYVNESALESEPDNLWQWIKDLFGNGKDVHVVREIEGYDSKPNTLQNIFYDKKVSQYSIPVELMINFLEISQSKDFVNSFIETVGNGNYIKVKLFTVRNKEINFISEEFKRDTRVTAKRDIKFTAKVTERNKYGIFDGGWNTDGLSGVSAKVTPNSSNSTYSISISGGNSDYMYRVEIYQDDIKVKTVTLGTTGFLWWNDTEWENSFEIYPKYVDDWTGSSTVIRTKEITNITDQYYPAISEIKTWYGSYKATNKVDRNYEILKRTKGSSSNENATNFTTVDGSGIINVMHRDDFQAQDLYKELVNAGLTINAVSYSNVGNWDSSWKTNTYYDGDDCYLIDYDNTTSDGVYTKTDIVNLQANYVMQKENGYSYEDLQYDKYVITDVKQTDTGLKVIDIKMNYTEEIADGIDNGCVTTSNKEIMTFLGLLCNKYSGEYKLGATFVPVSSGGTLVEYDDIYDETSRVGALLNDTDEMLYTLLEESTRTQGLVPVMKYAMYLYRNNNYTVKSWDNFNIFEQEDMISVK